MLSTKVTVCRNEDVAGKEIEEEGESWGQQERLFRAVSNETSNSRDKLDSHEVVRVVPSIDLSHQHSWRCCWYSEVEEAARRDQAAYLDVKERQNRTSI